MGAVWRMSLQTHYERDPAHSAVAVAAVWRGIWEDLQMSPCCGNVVSNVTINNQLNVQNQLYLFELKQIWIAAGFDIDVAFPETPDLFDSDPDDVGPEIAQRNLALCLSAESYTNTLFNRALAWLQSQTEEVAGIVIGAFAIPFIPFYAVLGGMVGLGVLAGTVVQQLIDSDYRQYIACAMYDALKGADTNSEAAFAASLDSLPARPPPPQNAIEDAARDLIEAWLRSQINNVENYLGFIDGLNTAFGMSSGLSDADCACLGVELYVITAGTIIPPVLEDLGNGRWRITSGTWDHPIGGMSDVGTVRRVGEGCFTISDAQLISGSLSRTGWQDCGGAGNFSDVGTPQNRANIEQYALQDIGETDGFVVEYDATLP